MYQNKPKTYQKQISNSSDDSDESSVYRIRNRDERDNPKQQIEQSQPLKTNKYVIINREGDEEEDDLELQSEIFLPQVRTQEEINLSQQYIQQKNQLEEQRQLKCNQVQEMKQKFKQNHNRYITRKQIIEVLNTNNSVQIITELQKINQWGLLSKAIDNIDISRFKDMSEKFLQIFYILMEQPENNYLFFIEEIFKSKQLLEQLKRMLESNKDKERLYWKFFKSTLGFLKISTNINIIPIDEVIAQYKIDKQLGKIVNYYQNDQFITNIREFHTEKLFQENMQKQEKEQSKQKSERLQQMYGIRIDYKQCPSEPTELDFQFPNNEPKPPFGQLFPVVQEGGYLSNELFINNHFYILREDYLQLFRKALWHLKQTGFYYGVQQVIQDAYVYENIILQSMSIDKQGLQVDLEVTPYQFEGRKPQKINWNITKRLMSGALIMFTDEEQSVKNIFFTVIKKQAEKENSPSVKVSLKLINGLLSSLIQLVSLLKSGKYVYLIENKVFYDPYIYFLNCLKQMDTRNIPFQDIIVAQKRIDVKPLYLQKAEDRNYGIDYNICLKLNLNMRNLNYNGVRIPLYKRWPHHIQESLDKSQVEAIQLMLRQGIGIIQGPPGTGKTFCGALAVRILQNNRDYIDRGLKGMEDNRPIIIVCYTNHALDQFLKHILTFTDKSKVVRIGGRCLDEDIQELLLQKQEKPNLSFPFRDYYDDKDYLEEQFMKEIKLNEIEFNSTKQLFKKDIIQICKGFLQMQSIKYEKHYISDESQEYIFNLWLNHTYKDLKLIHYLVVEQLEAKEKNKIISINNRGYHKDNYQNYSFGKFDEISNNKQLIQNRLDQDEEDDIQLNSDEEQDRQLYIYIENDDQAINIETEGRKYERNLRNLRNPTDLRNSYIRRQNNRNMFDDLEKSFNKQPQSLQLMNPRKLPDVWVNKIELLHKFYQQKFLKLGEEFQAEFDAFMEQSKRLQDLYMEQDLKIIQKKQIVGLTVTGCAKYAKHLDKLKFGIMIIEEAAEVLESHTIAILSKNVEHLILIGDHQQLRPKLENYMIEKKYKTNISLFERLINNGINFVTLSNQRRMRTDFANIIRLIYGDEYQDHPQTYQQNQVQIKGLKHFLVFFDHKYGEKNQFEFQSSKCNQFESGMITNLVKYLLANEYDQKCITVLSMYIKQVQEIKLLFKQENIQGVKIQTVDNYQGEENDIIILSLVRSNDKMQLGFVGVDNRICVALSRARLGLYVFGDFQFIENSVKNNITKNRNNSDLWIRIINQIKKSKNLMGELVLKCQSHENETRIKQLNDWRSSVHGGCQIQCSKKFTCGHMCKMKCHQFNHIKKNCPEKCEVQLECNHQCLYNCNIVPCPPCKTIVFKKLSICGHYQNAECHKRNQDIFCKSSCQRKLICDHQCPLLCGNNCSDAQCMVQINIMLDCNHMKTINCVDRANLNRCQCDVIIPNQLPCGHIKQIKCQDKYQDQQCEDNCKRNLNCGHLCKRKCFQRCDINKCKEIVLRIKDCGHQIQTECYISDRQLSQKCQKYVIKQLDCGHQLQIMCYQSTDNIICSEIIQVSSGKCKHNFSTTCSKRFDSFNEHLCDQICNLALICGHQCLQKCQICVDVGCHDICKITKQHRQGGFYGCMSQINEESKQLNKNVLQKLIYLKDNAMYKLIKQQSKIYFRPHQQEIVKFQIKFGFQFLNLQNKYDKLHNMYYHVLELIKLPNLFQLLSEYEFVKFKQKFCYVVYLQFNVVDYNYKYDYSDIQTDQIGRILKLLKGQIQCLRNLQCGHQCQQKFHLNFDKCKCEQVLQHKLGCGHDKVYKCKLKDLKCEEKCNKLLQCGHYCEQTCHQGDCKCQKQINHILECQNHQIMIECEKLIQLQFKVECDCFCQFKLPCGHVCNQKCGECYENIHNLCQTKVQDKYGLNVHCSTQPLSHWHFQYIPYNNKMNMLRPLKNNINLQASLFYEKLINVNISVSQQIILQIQIELIIKILDMNKDPQANKQKLSILNKILFREDLYQRANKEYMALLKSALA